MAEPHSGGEVDAAGNQCCDTDIGAHHDNFGVETFVGEKFLFGCEMNRPRGQSG